MYRELTAIAACPDADRFQALTHRPERGGAAFELAGGFHIVLGPGARGAVELDARVPFMDAPCYRLRPVGCAARSFYRIEYRLSAALLADLSALIPTLEASSPEGVTVFALLRLVRPDGGTADVGSAQIEVKRDRQLHSFPISLHDLPASDRTGVTEARLCFSIEARPAALHLHRLALHGVEARDDRLSQADLDTLRGLAARQSPRVRRAGITAQRGTGWTGRAEGHQRLADGVYLDFDPAAGRSATLSRADGRVEIAFEHLKDSGWRNLEFRFRDVHQSGSLILVLRAVDATGMQAVLRPRAILRQYDETGGWSDTPLRDPLPVFAGARDGQTKIDLSPLLDETRQIHRFGLMLFFPGEVDRLIFSEIEVFVIDRAAEDPPAVSRLDLPRLFRAAKRVARGRG